MNILDIRAQLEEELTWRLNELRFLRNQLAFIKDHDQKKLFRKSILVMLYSHFEGFCKTVFLIYIKTINQERVTRSNANDFIATASLVEIFRAYDNLDKKCELFKRALPDDNKLHKFARQVDFVREFNVFLAKIVDLPESIVDVESNLKPIVLRKILYRLGFPHDAFESFEGEINHLLNLRNSIAHGAYKQGLEQAEYAKIETATFDVMFRIKKIIISALDKQEFLKIPNGNTA